MRPGTEPLKLVLSISKSEETEIVSCSFANDLFKDMITALLVSTPRDDPYPGVNIFFGSNSSILISKFGIEMSSPIGRLSA